MLSRLNSEMLSMKNTVSMLESDKQYNEDAMRRTNTELSMLKSQYNDLHD